MTKQPVPFFAFGYPRSGTTALARLLNASDSASCIFYEGNILYRLHRILSKHGILDEPREDLILDLDVTARHNLIDKPKQGKILKPLFTERAVTALVDGFAADLEELGDFVEIFRRTTERFFQLLSAMGDFVAVGDKVPDYVNMPRTLHTALPEARFLYITRDPRAAVHSVLRFSANTLHLFAVPDALAMAVAWLLRRRAMDRFQRDCTEARVLSLTQEELKSHPTRVAVRASEFLGFDLDDAMKKHIESITEGIKDWRTEMTPAETHAVEAVIIGAGLGDNTDYALDPVENDWVERVFAVLPLIDCSAEGVFKALADAKRLFKGNQLSKTLGFLLLQIADWDHLQAAELRAQLLFEAAEKLIPLDPIFLYRYAEFCLDTKLLDKAHGLLSQLLEMGHQQDYFRFLRAKAFYQLGRIERLRGNNGAAMEFFTKSLVEYPPFSLPKAMVALLTKAGGTPACCAGALH